MADDKSELPEGTDKVIAGASATGRSGTSGGGTSRAGDGDVLVASESGSATGAPAAAATGATPSGGSGRVIDKLRSGGGKISGQAADKARGFLGQGIERSAEALANVGRMVGDTADGIDERLGPEYGEYARRAASAIEDAANNIAAKDPDELIEDTRNFVRKSPAVALAGAAVAGFVLARLVKTGLSALSDDDEDEGGRGGRGGSGNSSQA